MKVSKIPISDGELCHFPKQFYDAEISEDSTNQMILTVLAPEDTKFKLRRIELEHVSNIGQFDTDGYAYVGTHTHTDSGTWTVMLR
ncbi:hypothetical protein SAMN05192554_1203 [Haloarchaeobius iranensis]|uniref:Uncharacterized protein n=1 Tax=Haloarchaeobius iranensis TaxID=996166 RepID=A0A1G9ZE37_9EURY|nr:hypothetical protein SAMN05192554_1203 [Haloarchaeobius iranensis]